MSSSQRLVRGFLRVLKWLLIVLVFLVGAVAAFVHYAPTFGASASGESLARIKASTNYQGEGFVNLVPTRIDTRDPNQSIDIKTYFFPPPGKNPSTPLPSMAVDATSIAPGHFVWFGHSTVLFNTGDLMVLADPVFYRASPVPLIGNPFPLQNQYGIDSVPAIDVVIISHDHYDHLDHQAIRELSSRAKKFLVPLGVGAHLTRWGVPANNIIEFDWYQDVTIQGSQFVLTPARHFSGRGITNRFSTLWGSWVIRSDTMNVFFSGDSGYFNEFVKIGQRFGPFDIAFIENGAYSDHWTQIHMQPEEAVQASIDLKATVFFPIHWSKFDLAQHTWNEPVVRAAVAAQMHGVKMATPLIGQTFNLRDVPGERWWE